MTDLSTFVPENADDLLDVITEKASEAAGGKWNAVKDQIQGDLDFIANRAVKITAMLLAGEISQSDADLKMHLLELTLNNTLAEITVLAYVVAQAILNAVVDVVKAVIKNATGVELDF